ncbi:MAG: cyclohexanone monooxygenase [Solirubrobacterales bacterium 70-9]|nr:MAG: cyclohexanone monooxygenase [Solirubrobacterales bacterium 70-9]
MAQAADKHTTGGGSSLDFDAIVIGAGFGGLRTLLELRDKSGLSVKVLEAGEDVGGTWYWNRYPGARTDTESWAYCLSFDEELLDEWNWSERFTTQPEMEQYFQALSDRFDLRKDIQFGTRVTEAAFDEDADAWRVFTDAGETLGCRFLISAAGVLSITSDPPFPGIEEFAGEWYQTSLWPQEPVDFGGKRVAVVGTGATAVQVIPEVACQAKHLTVFQRTPNFVMPARNHPLRPAQMEEIKRTYGEIWEQVGTQAFAFPMDSAGRVSTEITDPAERRRVFEAGWEAGGFRYVFETFDDLFVDEAINEEAAEFVRDKIRTIVKDPETAELLCPTTHPLGGKRVPLGHFYYETYNRENVELVGVRDNPIEAVTPGGIRLHDGSEHEVDVIVFAIGFEAVTGALAAIDIRGRGGRDLSDRWADGAAAYLGLATDGFPNLFAILGPQSPFSNMPPMIERQVEFIGGAIRRMRDEGAARIEATADAVEAWSAECRAGLEATVIPGGLDDRPWFLSRLPDGRTNVLFYFSGVEAYRDELRSSLGNGLSGFELSSAAAAVSGG